MASDVSTENGLPALEAAAALQVRLLAVGAAARFHGADLDRADLEVPETSAASPAALAHWARQGGLWAKAVRLSWKQLVALQPKAPMVLLLDDGGAVLLVACDKQRDVVWVRHSRLAPSDPPLALNEAGLGRSWSGEALLIRSRRVRAMPKRRSRFPGSQDWSGWSGAQCATCCWPHLRSAC